MHATDPTVFVDDGFDDITFDDGVMVVSAGDENGLGGTTCIAVTDPDAEVPRNIPTILYTEASPKTAERSTRFDAYVNRDDRSGLESQARQVLASTVDRDAEEVALTRNDIEQDRLKRLYEGTTDLIMIGTVDELYEHAIGPTEHVLGLDSTSFFIHDGDSSYVAANNDDMAGTGLIPSDAGLLGETHRVKRLFLADDVRDHPMADPDNPTYRSAVSVPLGDDDVFQAVFSEVDAYDETDLTLTELLVPYVSKTRNRIRSETAARENREQIERLRRRTAEPATTTSLDKLFERTVGITGDILEPDISYVGVVEDGYIVPAAISLDALTDGAERVPLDNGGIVAEVYLSGSVDITDDVRNHPEAGPVKRVYCTVLSVPTEDLGVFQATTFTPGASDERGVELTELFTMRAAVTAKRIHAESRLHKERDHSTALFEHVSSVAVAYNMEADAAIVRDVNRAFRSALGYDADDVVGSDLLGRIVPPEPGPDPVPEPGVDETISKFLVATGESYRGEAHHRTDGGVRELTLSVVPLSPGEERGAGYTIYTGIAKREAREGELERQNKHLEEFASIVSCGLRSPLSVARGNLELIREAGDEIWFDTVERVLEQMEEFIDGPLSLARRGQLIDGAERTDLRTVAWQAWATTDTGDAELVTSQPVVVDTDEDRLAKLFFNLLQNAVRHGSTGNQAASGDAVEHGSTDSRGTPDDAVGYDGRDVRVEVDGVGGSFYVEGDGPSIEPERRDEVFELGGTTGRDGVDCGLAIVQSITETHDWSTIMTSGTTGGVCFEFRV